MNPFAWIVALGPIAIYSLLIGTLHFRRRVSVLTGNRDAACLGLGMIGLYLIGPAELFFPNAAFNLLGVSVWLMLILLYFLLLTFIILNARPRLILYGLDVEETTRHLDRVLERLAPTAKWLDHHLVAPELGVQAVVETANPGNVTQIVATLSEQNLQGWKTLERELVMETQAIRPASREQGKGWLAAGVILLIGIGYALVRESPAVAQGFKEMLRL